MPGIHINIVTSILESIGIDPSMIPLDATSVVTNVGKVYIRWNGEYVRDPQGHYVMSGNRRLVVPVNKEVVVEARSRDVPTRS